MAARQSRKKNYVHSLVIDFPVSLRILMTQIGVTNVRNKMHDHSVPEQSFEPQRKKAHFNSKQAYCTYTLQR